MSKAPDIIIREQAAIIKELRERIAKQDEILAALIRETSTVIQKLEKWEPPVTNDPQLPYITTGYHHTEP